jgi:Bacterial Ig domain
MKAQRDHGAARCTSGDRMPAARHASKTALVVAACLIVGLSLRPSTAGAAVVVGSVQPVAGTKSLTALACPSTSDCLAVGASTQESGGVVVPVANGEPGAVQGVSGAFPQGVECSGVGTCLVVASKNDDPEAAGGVGQLVPITAGVAGSPVAAVSPGHLAGIACATPGSCISVGGVGGATGPGLAVPVADGVNGSPRDVGGTFTLAGVACSSPDTCYAIGKSARDASGSGMFVPIVDGTIGGAQPVAGTSVLDAIACQSAILCVAVGQYAAPGATADVGVVVPVTDGVPGAAETIPGVASFSGVACASVTTCIAVGDTGTSAGILVPIVSGVGGTVQDIGVSGDGLVFGGIACSGASECIAGATTASSVGALVSLLLSGSPTGPPAALIASPPSGTSYNLNDPGQPEFEFSCTPAFASTLTPSGGCTGTVNGTPVADGSAIDTSVGGSFSLSVTANDADGEQATATTSYTVAQAAQTITFPQIGPLRYGPAPIDLTASASSGLSVTYSVLSGPCAVAGQALRFTSSGSCAVSADQAGNASYLAAPRVTSTIEMNAPTPPVCAVQNVSTANAGPLVIALGCVDAPGDAGDALTYAIAAQPSHGVLSGLDAAGGIVTYTPSGTYGGPDSFTFTAADAQGTSAATTVSIAVAPPVAPSDDSAPGVSGIVAAGQALSCTPGVWYGATPQTYTYQWQRDGTAVPGATGPAYAIQAADEGRSLACIVTAVNTGGSARAASAVVDVPHTPPSTAPVTVARPAISGVAARGRTLSCSPGAWSGATPQTYAYQWKRGGASIAGATAARHVVSAADAGHRLTCTVTAKNSLGHRSAITRSIAIPPGSSAFTLRRVTAGKTGTIQVSLQAPGAGHFVVSAKFASTVSGSYGRATGTVTKAGRTQLAIHPTKQATAVLRGGHRESVAVSVAFTPTGGKASTTSAKLSLAAPGGGG